MIQRDMTYGSPLKLIVAFVIPILIGNIFQQFYSMVDTFVVGRFVGVSALAALGASGAMQFLVIGFVIGLTAGFSVVISQKFGAGDIPAMKQAIAMSIIASAVLSVIMTALSMGTSTWLLGLLKTPQDIIIQANIYISIIFGGLTATVFYNLFASMLRAVGDSRAPLFFLIIASVMNIILDLLFILVFKAGCAGVAAATVIAQAFSAVVSLFYIYRKYPDLQPHREDWRYNSKIMGNLLRIGIPAALQFSVCAIGVLVIQGCINNLGSEIVAAYTIGCKVENLIVQPLPTLGLGIATFAGQNIGAGKLDRVKIGVRNTMWLSVAISLLCLGLVMFLGRPIVSLFVEPHQMFVVDNAVLYLRIASLFFIPLGFIFVLRNASQGCGSGLIPLLSSLQELLFRVLVAILLAGPLGYFGICLASPIAWVAAAVLLAVAFSIQMRNIGKKLVPVAVA